MNTPFQTWTNGVREDSTCRLSDMTRSLAWRAITGEHGRSMLTADFYIEAQYDHDTEANAIYADIVERIVDEAPLRILEGEKLIGSATFLEAPRHMTPGSNIRGTSHVTIGFQPVQQTGYAGLRRRIEERLQDSGLDRSGIGLLKAMLRCLDAAARWHGRYMELLDARTSSSSGQARQNYIEVRERARNVPEQAPRNFSEAVQSLWLMYCFQRLCGNWSGLGRLDQMLGPYLICRSMWSTTKC